MKEMNAINKLYKLEFNKDDLWVNIGIVGHKTHKIGSIYEVKKVITNEGKVVAGGYTLNDGDLLGMNYYVQGVIGKIPN